MWQRLHKGLFLSLCQASYLESHRSHIWVHVYCQGGRKCAVWTLPPVRVADRFNILALHTPGLHPSIHPSLPTSPCFCSLDQSDYKMSLKVWKTCFFLSVCEHESYFKWSTTCSCYVLIMLEINWLFFSICTLSCKLQENHLSSFFTCFIPPL